MNPSSQPFLAFRKLWVLPFVAAIFLMISGDFPAPPSGLKVVRRVLVLLSWPQLYLLLLALSFLFHLPAVRTLKTDIRPVRFLMWPVISLTAAFLLSAIFSSEQRLSLGAFADYTAMLFIVLLFCILLHDAETHDTFWILLAVASLFLALRTLSWRLSEGLEKPAFHIGNNAWLGKLQIAWVLNLPAPVFFGRYLSSAGQRWRWLFLTTWLASGIAISVLWARAGTLAFVFSTIVMCALNSKAWKRWLPACALFACISVPIVLRNPSVAGAFIDSATRLSDQPGYALRVRIWQDSLKMLRDHPLTGIGLGTYDVIAYTQYHTTNDTASGVSNWFYRRGWHAHNLLIHLLAETGLVGFSAALYLLLSVLFHFLQKWRGTYRDSTRIHASALACSLLAFLLLSMTENLIGVRVHESLRMNLTLWFIIILGVQTVSRDSEPSEAVSTS